MAVRVASLDHCRVCDTQSHYGTTNCVDSRLEVVQHWREVADGLSDLPGSPSRCVMPA